MKHPEHRGVSLGTITMLGLTLVVLVTCLCVLPQLMGKVNLNLADLAMSSSVNLNDSLPELTMADIPIANVTQTPAALETPLPASESPVPTVVIETASPTPITGGSVSLTFGGSIVMDDATRKSGYDSDLEQYDYSEELSLIADDLDSDMTFVTLESVIDPSGNVRRMPNAPDNVLDMLAGANVDVVALGYNRAADLGFESLQSTVAQAQGRGLETIGAYASADDAKRLRIFTINNVRVGYLHYTNVIESTGKRKLESEDASFALPTAVIGSPELIAGDVIRLRQEGAQIVIVSINWSGSSKFSTTSTKRKTFMQTIADAGADVIVGSGTKSVREVSWIMGNRDDGTTRQTLCAWSWGSLLNGERKDGNVAGMLLHLQMSFNGSSVSFERVSYTPTYIWRYKQDNAYRYRVVASDLTPPDAMDDSQADNAARAFENLKKSLGDSPINLRTK